MLTLADLENLLLLNEQLTLAALRDEYYNSFERLCALQLHRSIIKDMIVDLLKEELNKTALKKAA